MKALTTAGLTKLIQLIKSSFIKTTDTVTTNTVTLADVATSGDYDDLINQPTIGNGTITFTQGGVTKGTITTNQAGNTTIALDAGGGGGGAVDSVNGQTGTVVLTASDVGALADTTTIPSKTSDLTNDSGFITGITSSDVTTALGYTPYNSTNPSGYITSSALNGYATETWVGNQGYLTGITSSDVVTALTYTPYNGATNPNGYITSADLPTNYVTTDTAQDISGRKTFLGEKAIYFKQQATTNKLGFTLYNPSNTELAALEYRPNTIGSASLLALNCPQTTGGYVGFRYRGTPAVNIVAPKVATAGNYFMATHITNGTLTVTADNQGIVNISSLLPDVSGFVTQTWVQNQNYLTVAALTDYVTNTSLATTLQNYVTSSSLTTVLNDYQPLLESGINIKTVNNTSLLGSGNIDTSDIFIAEYGITTFAEIQTAYENNKNVILVWDGAIFPLSRISDTFAEFSSIYNHGTNAKFLDFVTCNNQNVWTRDLMSVLDRSLSNLDATGQAIIDGKVSKSGDTMTGQLTITSSETRIEQNDTDVVKGTNPSSDTFWGMIFNASGGDDTWQSKRLGYIEETLKTDGSTTLNIGTYQNVANSTSLSRFSLNMTQAGVASCTFPDTECVDGRVYTTTKTLLDNGNLSVAEHSYSLSSYLPDDGNVYEIFLEIRGRTGTTSGNYAAIYANGGTTSCNLVYTTTRSSNFTTFCGYGSVYVSSARSLLIKLSGNATTNTTIVIRGYRRIGTNK